MLKSGMAGWLWRDTLVGALQASQMLTARSFSPRSGSDGQGPWARTNSFFGAQAVAKLISPRAGRWALCTGSAPTEGELSDEARFCLVALETSNPVISGPEASVILMRVRCGPVSATSAEPPAATAISRTRDRLMPKLPCSWPAPGWGVWANRSKIRCGQCRRWPVSVTVITAWAPSAVVPQRSGREKGAARVRAALFPV
jgi:hypothetical protein